MRELSLFAGEEPTTDRSSINLVPRRPRPHADGERPVPPPLKLAPVRESEHNAVALEDEIIAALDTPASPGERTADAFRNKEHAIGFLFGKFSVSDAKALHQRLIRNESEDLL
ncbi:MAG TPA: hypothetical protein VGC41_17480, partial [Kofleriaceae bacterium]